MEAAFRGGCSFVTDTAPVQTDIEIAHPDVVFYDFYEAWNTPIESDEDIYLSESLHVRRRRSLQNRG